MIIPSIILAKTDIIGKVLKNKTEEENHNLKDKIDYNNSGKENPLQIIDVQ